jgi:dTDP-4-dehydrorhamnose reductase
MKPMIAVSGKDGQLGWELERISSGHPQFDFIFCSRNDLDITNQEQVTSFFSLHKPFAFINCAAYTAVDKAETDHESAYKINAEAVGFLAKQCSIHNTLFITFSTDYVFDGNGIAPYLENQPTKPINYYGYTKEAGEKFALELWEKSIIIRTSWVYSVHGNNFVKTMLRLMKERPEINVVNDQIGSPTYAKDLAETTMKIIGAGKADYGIYHFSNEGNISWFDFAMEIKRMSALSCKINPVSSSEFPTPAKRPKFSVLSKHRIISDFGIELKDWKESLEDCIKALNEKSSL